METNFEVSGGPNLLTGEITHAGIHEVTEPVAPTTIIRTDQDWYVHLKWKLTGSLVGMIGGDWHIQTFLESIGLGFEGELNAPGDTVPVNPGSPEYEHEFHVKAGAVPAGTYKLSTTILYTRPDGVPGPLAGSLDVPLVQFYDPGP